ncbi:MAG: hypothetical protein L6264_10800 [Weeksellaceae bacterium]|nr:hypothetical protein [Bacteroidota bacterium]MCG2781428.1 hypothetical protein [Weeksellaceae bacterium]
MKTYPERLLVDEMKYHFPDLKLNGKYEIRLLRVLKHERVNNFNNNSVWKLLFYANDWLEPGENHICFYSLCINNSRKIIGIEYLYFENGTKAENLLFEKKINRILSFLFKSQYNIKATN